MFSYMNPSACRPRGRAARAPRVESTPRSCAENFFQSLENGRKNFPIIGKMGRIFPTIGKKFSNHWKKWNGFSNHWKVFFQWLENRGASGLAETRGGCGGGQSRPTARRAALRVCWAVLRAQAAPSWRMASTWSGCAASSSRRARRGAKCSSKRAASSFLAVP